jgi:hypothetical protein
MDGERDVAEVPVVETTVTGSRLLARVRGELDYLTAPFFQQWRQARDRGAVLGLACVPVAAQPAGHDRDRSILRIYDTVAQAEAVFGG